MLTTGHQLRAARSLIGMDQNALADLAGLNVNTIRSMEASGASGIAGRASNVQTVQRVLEQAGVEFLNHGQPGVRLKKVSSAAIQGAEMEIGDAVSYREERPGGDLKNLGKIGKLIDPGYKPHFPTHVCVEFDGDGGKWVDKGMLVLRAKGGSAAG